MKNVKFKLPDSKTLKVEVEDTVQVKAFILELKEKQILDSTKSYILSSSSGNIIPEGNSFRFLQEDIYLISEQTSNEVDSLESQLKLKQEQLKNKLQMNKEMFSETLEKKSQIEDHNTGNKIIIPPGKLAMEYKEVFRSGNIMKLKIQIPPGKLMDDDPLAKKRKEIKKKLEEAKNIPISKTGEVNPKATDNSKTGNAIQIPPGKLASFYWYERDPELYQAEIEAMNNSFPDFQLGKLDDGRLYWEGKIQPKLSGNNTYHLLLAYNNNHPSTVEYGGSVKCYLVDPEIEDLEAKHGRGLPHIMRDSANNKYLCTNSTDSFKDSKTHSTSASTSLRWAVKWITVYELFAAGDITYEEFASHNKF